jgi:hypothetical protein
MASCKICGSTTYVTHHGVLLGRHDVAYHMCPECEYCCTDEPFWLEEAYSDAIDATDTGLVQRNLTWARWLRVMLPRLFPDGPYVDWAGGCGMMVRLMRDAGFAFYWQDRYAHNLLSRGFDWESHSDQVPALVTAIEVLEHTPDPLEFFHEVISGTGTRAILFTQELHSGQPFDPTWWYLAPVTGQHISFFSDLTLQKVADRLGMHLWSSPPVHLLTFEPFNAGRYRPAARTSKLVNLAARVPGLLSRSPAPLTQSDHEQIVRDFQLRPDTK